MFKFKRQLYESLPFFLRRLVRFVPFGVLAGKSYRDVCARSRTMEFAGGETLRQFQEDALGRILIFATRHVRAYKQLAEAVDQLPPRMAIREFPLLDKATIKQNPQDFLADDLSESRYWETTTGGTSGDQLQFFLDNSAQSREMAFIHRLWARVGYSPQTSKATFRGVKFARAAQGRYWQDNPIYNERQFSPFHLSESTLCAYIRAIRDYRPQFLHGYPSSIGYLAVLCGRHGVDVKDLGIRAALLGSEAVLPEQRRAIESAFGTRVYSWYGHSERIILAGECEHSSVYHHVPDYGFLEILDNNGNEVCEGESGEIVGTGYWNDVMPLIRYRTGDAARRLSTTCECGRSHERFDQVQGRWAQEYVVGSNGAMMSLAALNMHGPEWENVARYQYVQERPGEIELRLMVTHEFSNADAGGLVRAFEKRVGSNLRVYIRVVDDIPLTARGKLKRLDQRLRIESVHDLFSAVTSNSQSSEPVIGM
ncbi:MAG TPA: hypothetical protein VGK58_09915 [Lacipirellulaceae bacterium]